MNRALKRILYQTGRRVNFTLLELLIVIAIIAIVASMLLPVLGLARARGRSIECVSKQKQIGLAFQMYVNDYCGYAPLPYDPGSKYFYWHNNLYFNGYFGKPGDQYKQATYRLAQPKFVCPAMPPYTSGGTTPGNDSNNFFNFSYGICGLAQKDYSWGNAGAARYGYIVKKLGRISPSECGLIVDSWDSAQKYQVYSLAFIIGYGGPRSDVGFALIHRNTGNMLMVDGHIRNWRKDDINKFNAQISTYKFGDIPYIYPQM